MYLKLQINMGNVQYIHTASFEQNISWDAAIAEVLSTRRCRHLVHTSVTFSRMNI